jgi:hypothetical protein
MISTRIADVELGVRADSRERLSDEMNGGTPLVPPSACLGFSFMTCVS